MATFIPVTLRYPSDRDYHGLALRPGVNQVQAEEWDAARAAAAKAAEKLGVPGPMDLDLADGVLEATDPRAPPSEEPQPKKGRRGQE